MTLTIGDGPFAGRTHHGELNFDLDGVSPKHQLFLSNYPLRLRATVAGRTVLDTRRARLLHETGILPQPYAPLEDYDRSLLEATETVTHCPFKGDASYWTLRVDGEERADALWTYETPQPESSWLKGYGCLYWDRVDEWWVEDERQAGHLRDPFHRVDVLESSRHVVVRAGAMLVAETSRPKLIFETGLPVRAYVPRADVSVALEPSDTRSVCPYKGHASYWHAVVDDRRLTDAAWSYEVALPEAKEARGHVCFDLGEGLEVEVG